MGEYAHVPQDPLSGDQRLISHTTLTEYSGHRSRSFTPLTDCACHSGTTDRSSVHSDSDICIRTISAELSTHAYASRPCCHTKNEQSVLPTRKESCDFYIDRRLSDSRNIRSVKIEEQPLSRQSLMKMQSDYVLSSRAATVEHIRWQSLKHTGCSDCDWKTLKHRNSFENYHDRNFMKQSSYVNNDGDSLKQSNSFEICDGNSAKQRRCGNCESNSFNDSNRSEDIDRNLSEQKHSCDKCNKKTLNQNSCRYCDRQNKPLRGNSNSNLLYTDKFIRTNEINHIRVPALDFSSSPDDTSGNIDDQDPLSARLQRDQPSKVNFLNCDGKVKAYKSTNNDVAGHCLNSGSGDNVPDVNNRRKSETLEMTDTINTFHICEPSCKGTPMDSNEITDAICTLHVCEPNCKGIPDKPKEMKDAKYKLHLCGPDGNRIPNDSKEKKHTINKFHICEPNSAGTPVKSKAMTDTINTLHICEPSFRRIPLLPYRNALTSRCSGQSCSRAKDLKPRQTKGQCSAKAPTAMSVDSQYFHVCKSPIGVKENTCTKSLLSNIQVVNTQPRYCNCDGNRHNLAAKEIMFKKENEGIPQTSAENSNEPLLSEDVVWIKRIDTDILSHSEVKDKRLRSNGKRITHNDR